MSKKGFTLIELLAVIVILGVLLLIAVPTISKLIDASKRNAFIIDAKAYVQAAKYMNMTGNVEEFIMYSIGDTDSDLEKIDNEVDGTGVSPWGNKYNGYIVALKNKNGMKYSVYIREVTEDKKGLCHSIGFTASSVDNFYLEDALKVSNIVDANCDDIEDRDIYEKFFSDEKIEIEESEGGGEANNNPSFALNIVGESNQVESLAFFKDETGKIIVEELLEKGSQVFLNVCSKEEVEQNGGIEKRKMWENCLYPFSVIIETDRELYLYERPRPGAMDRNYSYKSINSNISKAKEIYEMVIGPLTSYQFRLLEIKDIKASLNNNVLSKENLVKFGQVFNPFSWGWFSEKNQGVYWGQCRYGGIISGEKCIWNPKAYTPISESELRTYSSVYWIAGSSDEIAGFNSDRSYKFYAEGDGFYKGTTVPAINLNEKYIIIEKTPEFTNEMYYSFDYKLNKYNTHQTKIFAYAYYVLTHEKSKFNDLLYCMNDSYDGFELCEEFKTEPENK